MATYNPYQQRDWLDEPTSIQNLKAWWFTVRWCWIHRNWSPTRQKLKAYDRDLERYRKTGRKPF